MSRFSSLFYSFYEKNSYLSSLRADGPSFKLIMSRGFHTGLPTCMRKKERRRKKLTNRIKIKFFCLRIKFRKQFSVLGLNFVVDGEEMEVEKSIEFSVLSLFLSLRLISWQIFFFFILILLGSRKV
jgi:hypothetical protein